ncbi:MAG: hypothetical protein Q9216_002645 [Gyalolechia sp. 2 TL-2023]
MHQISEQDRPSKHEGQSRLVNRSQSSIGLPTQRPLPDSDPPARSSQLDRLASQETSKSVDNTQSPIGARLDSSKQKDPKSFAQNLFDTTAIDKFFDAPTSVDKLTFPSNRRQEASAKEAHPKQEDRQSLGKVDCESVRDQSHRVEHEASHYLSPLKHAHDPPVERGKIDHSYLKTNQRKPSSLRGPNTRQTLSYFSMQNVKALIAAAQKSHKDSQKRQQSTSGASPPNSPIVSFARQSIAYVFSTPQALQASFREDTASGCGSSYGKPIDFGCMVESFHWLDKLDTRPRIVISSLSIATKGFHEQDRIASNLPAQDYIRGHPRIRNTTLDDHDFRSMNEEEATHVTMLIFAVLIAIVPPCNPAIWGLVYQCHQAGSMVPSGVKDPAVISSVQVVLDAFDDELALDLLSKLCESLAGRLNIPGTERLFDRGQELYNDAANVVERLIDHIFNSEDRHLLYYRTDPQTSSLQPSPPARDGASGDSQRYFGMIAEWLRYFIVKNWDGKAEIDRFSAVGDRLVTTTIGSEIAVMRARFDFLNDPIKWLERPGLENPAHLLAYPFVFGLKGQITCFRAINYARMFRKYEDSILTSRLLTQMTFPDSLTGRGQIRVQEKLEDFLKSYFVLEISRENILLDAMNQLWRRKKQEMTKPLKVR